MNIQLKNIRVPLAQNPVYFAEADRMASTNIKRKLRCYPVGSEAEE